MLCNLATNLIVAGEGWIARDFRKPLTFLKFGSSYGLHCLAFLHACFLHYFLKDLCLFAYLLLRSMNSFGHECYKTRMTIFPKKTLLYK